MAGSTDFQDDPIGAAMSKFARLIRGVAWFSSLGEQLSAAELADAERYVAALGFPAAAIATVDDWEEAESCVRNPDWNTAWWEAEEQLRVALLDEAGAILPQDELMRALTRATQAASDVVHGAAAVAAARSGVADQGLVRAAAGAATQACYQAALVLVTDGDDEHPFALKFRLFEAGRWPLGIVGQTFNIF